MAIKVNGTNVITDGRALNNITSVDATTAAAIGAGGVGGGFEELVDTTGSGSYVQYNFPSGYRVFHIYWGDFITNSSSYYEQLMVRFTDGSNNLITQSEYQWINQNGGTDQNNAEIQAGYAQKDGSKQRAGRCVIWNPRESSHTTGFSFYHTGKYDTYYEHFDKHGGMEYQEANNGIRFYPDVGSSISSFRYSIYGLKG